MNHRDTYDPRTRQDRVACVNRMDLPVDVVPQLYTRGERRITPASLRTWTTRDLENLRAALRQNLADVETVLARRDRSVGTPEQAVSQLSSSRPRGRKFQVLEGGKS